MWLSLKNVLNRYICHLLVFENLGFFVPFSLLLNYMDQKKNKAKSAGCNQAIGGDLRMAGTGTGPGAPLLTRPLSSQKF